MFSIRFGPATSVEIPANRVALVDAGEGNWITQLCWSEWELLDDFSGESNANPVSALQLKWKVHYSSSTTRLQRTRYRRKGLTRYGYCRSGRTIA